MSQKKATARPGPLLRPGERRRLAQDSKDVDYLSLKEQLAEPLSPDERETLRAWRELAKALDTPEGPP